MAAKIDRKTVVFFLKISKEIGKACRKSRTRAQRASLTLSVSPQVSLSVFSLVPDLLFDCSRVAYLNTQKYGLFAVHCEKVPFGLLKFSSM